MPILCWAFPPSLCWLPTPSSVCSYAAVEPPAPRRRGPGSRLEHGRQLHHQHQLAVVHARDHHELSHPDGRPGDAQLLVSGDGHRGGRGPDPRHQADQLRPPSATFGWTRRAHCSMCCCRPPSSARCCWLRRAYRRTCTHTPRRIRWKAKRRPLRKVPWPRRKLSRSWAPTAADSSTPTAPIPSRTPRRSQPLRNVLDLLDWRRDSRIRWAA
jgi:hypothetical protein